MKKKYPPIARIVVLADAQSMLCASVDVEVRGYNQNESIYVGDTDEP